MTHDQVTPHSVEMTESKLVKLSLLTGDGDEVSLVMTSNALLDLMSMGVKLLNTHTPQFMANAVASE